MGLCLPYLAFLPASVAAKARPVASPDSNYAAALATADRLLQAWQTGDIEHGIVLLTTRAKQTTTSGQVEKFFSNEGVSSYEVSRGKLLRRGRYEFPVALVDTASDHHARRHFSTIVVVNTGKNDWAVDKLP